MALFTAPTNDDQVGISGSGRLVIRGPYQKDSMTSTIKPSSMLIVRIVPLSRYSDYTASNGGSGLGFT